MKTPNNSGSGNPVTSREWPRVYTLSAHLMTSLGCWGTPPHMSPPAQLAPLRFIIRKQSNKSLHSLTPSPTTYMPSCVCKRTATHTHIHTHTHTYAHTQREAQRGRKKNRQTDTHTLPAHAYTYTLHADTTHLCTHREYIDERIPKQHATIDIC
jgi:ABC-type nickel/cobalt efflux system permease component RcnA